jgi:hypothetical protein
LRLLELPDDTDPGVIPERYRRIGLAAIVQIRRDLATRSARTAEARGVTGAQRRALDRHLAGDTTSITTARALDAIVERHETSTTLAQARRNHPSAMLTSSRGSDEH